ncbi:DUF2868 domain-containing protein [Halochromatium salexigens]|uniref:DUF2868 domain-containing protein n=1 Tax=Halochromatium salexigens TaxID=49447 RepID=A0AAJ0XFF7_HALSE|nr:DUF2868 domain-containing protein [Halochromatium salexigens]MBK5929655.1 hypothetical protein [Halochromatium salexigens]
MDSPLRRLAPILKGARGHRADTLRWQVPDLIDFDYYVDEDERLLHEQPAQRKYLAERDRHLYKDQIAPIIGEADAHSSKHRNRALRWWLELRRKQEDPGLAELLPGQAFARAQRLVSTAMGVIGFAVGLGAASTLLHYEGDHPVNVSWYLFWLVLLQLILVGTTIGLWYGRRSKIIKGATQDLSLLGQVLRPLFSRAARWIQKQRITHVAPELRERTKAKQGLLQANYALYGPASYLPMLVPAQVFGIGFNIGAILMTIAMIWFADLGFGWGSAMNISAETVQHLARLIALPWSWLFGEGVGVPTLQEIAGTRISLKDPLYVLNADQLRSWRWFLVLAVFTYGLLPRVALLGLSAFKQRRALATLPFTHQSAQAPYARMITPSIEIRTIHTGAGPEMPIPAPLKPLTRPTSAPRPPKTPVAPEASTPAPKEELAAPASPPAPAPGADQPSARQASPEPATAAGQPTPLIAQLPPSAASSERISVEADACLLLLHIDVADMLEEQDHARLQQLLRDQTGWRVAAAATYGGGRAMTEQAIEMIRHATWSAPPARIALIQDGSQPPITENLRLLRAVRSAAGNQAQVLLALTGDPDDDRDDPLPPLSGFDFADWQRKIEQMGDPYLRLIMLAPPDDEAS